MEELVEDVQEWLSKWLSTPTGSLTIGVLSFALRMILAYVDQRRGTQRKKYHHHHPPPTPTPPPSS